MRGIRAKGSYTDYKIFKIVSIPKRES